MVVVKPAADNQVLNETNKIWIFHLELLEELNWREPDERILPFSAT